MINKILQSEKLSVAAYLYAETRLGKKINAVLLEDERYAADELVELAEEILSSIAANGFAHYIQSAIQKEVYNDFLIELFTSSEHAFNAGPLYRWAANMVKDDTNLQKQKLYRFFWDSQNDKLLLAADVHSLAELRNRVMHGFFVLPPEENRKYADAIGTLLIDLHDAGFFSLDAVYHFISNGHFTGQWNISDESQWLQLMTENSFGTLVKQILNQRDSSFWSAGLKEINQQDRVFIPSSLYHFISSHQRGAYAIWVHPNSKYQDYYYNHIANWLNKQHDILTIAYTLQEKGVSFTSGFLLDRLLQVLNKTGKILSGAKKKEEHLKALRQSHSFKIVVLINRVEIALFSVQHVTKIFSLLQELNIIIVVVGQHFEYFNTFFTAAESIPHTKVVPDPSKRLSILNNYLRFKGPHADRKEDEKDVKTLREIMDRICDALQQGQKIYARRFADEYQYDIEYVYEIFAVLYPWVHNEREKFEEDTIDDLYGFPSLITETTPIYLALGRRDIKLEYQHKVISI